VEDAFRLVDLVAGMHAHFFQADVLLQEEILVAKDKNGDPVPIWFHGTLEGYLAKTGTSAEYYDFIKKGTGFDVLANPDMKYMVDICEKHGKVLFKEFYKVLNSRPKTLVHGDMRSDNIFQHQTDCTRYKFIDWQTLGACAPGVEFTQLLAGSLWAQDFDRLPEILDRYIAGLHSRNPAAKIYTRAMVEEDFCMTTCMLLCVGESILAGILSGQPLDSPLWKLLVRHCERLVKCLDVLKGAALVKRVAKGAGLA